VLCEQTGSIVSELRWVDRRGAVLRTFGEPAEYTMPTIEPSQRQFVVSLLDPSSGTLDIWRHDMDRNVDRRLTFDPADDWCSIVSPDGKQVAFTSNRSNYPQIYLKALDGAEPERQIGSTQRARWPLSWSPDGRFIALREIDRSADINVLDLQSYTSRPFLASPFAETDAVFAPSGRWMAYVSNESGRIEVYVTTFPEGSARWQISSGGGSQPRWRRDGKELYYYAADGWIVAVPIEIRPEFKAGIPQRLFAGDLRTTREDLREFDAAPDGEHFLIDTSGGRPRALPLTVAVGPLNR